MVPEITRQPAIVPTRLMTNVRRTSARPDSVSRRSGLEHALEGGFQVFGYLVNDLVSANLDAALFRKRAGFFVRNHVEANDHGVRSIGQMNIRL